MQFKNYHVGVDCDLLLLPLPVPASAACPQVELHQENNAYLSYWLSNTVTLLYLMQKNIKPASGGGYAARLKASGQQVGGWAGRKQAQRA
jgi:hypothetical protein